MSAPALLRRLLSRTRAPVALALTLLCITAWALLLDRAPLTPQATHGLGSVALDDLCRSIPPTFANAPSVLAIWLLMSIAMMLPTAAPAILTFADLSERARMTSRPISLLAFIVGYLCLWMGFAIIATLTQVGLARIMIGLPATAPAATVSALLLLAGAYQFAPLKHACLTHCRNPMAYFLAHWREGTHGALAMGVRHGAYCVGCCWALMLLMVAAGAMNAAWTAGLTVLMLAEKVLPAGDRIGRAVGVALVCLGLLRLSTMAFI